MDGFKTIPRNRFSGMVLLRQPFLKFDFLGQLI